MDCPKCSTRLGDGLPACSACEFRLADLDAVLGHDLVALDRLTDAAHSLRLPERQKVEAFLEEFERTFPQVFVAVYLGILPQTLSLKELTFWLLNHAAFNTRGFQRLNEYSVVLVIDPVAKSAALNVGYALEHVFAGKRLHKILRSMRTALWHAEYVNAIRLALKGISGNLKRKATRQPRSQELLPPPPANAEEFVQGSGLQPLRKTEPAPSEPLQADMVPPPSQP